MNAWPDELRLIAVIATNALMLAACWRIARGGNSRAVAALPDALLYWLAAQYVITGTCGMLGVLWPGLMLAIACMLSSLAIFRSPSPRGRGSRRAQLTLVAEDRIVWTAFAFVLAYAGAFIFHQHFIPEMATDPLVYHVPAAAHWIQDGRISLVDFWYWLPANTYSPLAGSVWIAWWMGPLGNDALSRYVQLPTWLLLFAACLRLLRDVRVPMLIAAIVAASLVLTRPFVMQLTIAKDDIAVAALAMTVLGGLHVRRLREPAAPFRLGIAFGLLISTKYPAILAMAIAAPAILTFCWWRMLRVRGVLIAAAISIAFVAPWLIRNAIVTGGNPVYPFFSGGGGFIADPQLRTFAGVWAMLAQSFFSPRPAVWCLIAVAAIFLLIAAPRRLLGRLDGGIGRSLLFGPPLANVLLVITFPWPEVRYLFAAIAAAIVLVGVAIARIADRRLACLTAAAWFAITYVTSGTEHSLTETWPMLLSACVTASIVFLALGRLPFADWRVRAGVPVVIATALLLGIYVFWYAFLRISYPRDTNDTWHSSGAIGPIGEMWAKIRENLPPGLTIAYVNTPTTWPLFGFDLQYHVVYAPVRPGIMHLHDLPPIRERVPAKDEYVAATRQLNEDADEATWLANLERLKVDVLFVAKADASDDPPELRFIAAHPDRFHRVSENEAAIVVRVER